MGIPLFQPFNPSSPSLKGALNTLGAFLFTALAASCCARSGGPELLATRPPWVREAAYTALVISFAAPGTEMAGCQAMGRACPDDEATAIIAEKGSTAIAACTTVHHAVTSVQSKQNVLRMLLMCNSLLAPALSGTEMGSAPPGRTSPAKSAPDGGSVGSLSLPS
jgi:hypothetical protein